MNTQNLISKEFLKQGKVFEMMSIDPDCEEPLLNEIKLMESLLDDPEHSDNAQKRLTHLVYKYLGGYVDTFDQDPEGFVNSILYINRLSESPKLISKEFLKQGKVSEMMSSSQNVDEGRLNRAIEYKSLLDDPEKSDFAQQELTKLVGEVISGAFEFFREKPEVFVQAITYLNQKSQ